MLIFTHSCNTLIADGIRYITELAWVVALRLIVKCKCTKVVISNAVCIVQCCFHIPISRFATRFSIR